MLGRNAGLFASCALGASAFLLPPTTSSADSSRDGGLAHLPLPFVDVDQKSQILELPCSSCAFPIKTNELASDAEIEDLFWVQGGANNLLLNFTISDDGRALSLNDEPIYPATTAASELRQSSFDWFIKQIPASTSRKELESGDFVGTPLRITGAAMTLAPYGPDSMSIDGDQLISLEWQLFGLEGQPMTVDEVQIQLLRSMDGELFILSIGSAPGHFMDDLAFPRPALGHDRPQGPPRNCKHLPQALCRFISMLDDNLPALGHGGRPSGCHGKGLRPGHLPTHIKTHFGPFDSDSSHHGKPHGRPHGHHGPHRHGLFHSISRAILAILIPVMAGVTVGMFVSVLGLLVGRCLGWLWFTVVRGGRRGYSRIALDDSNVDMRKESPPQYEEAPAYEVVDAVEKE